MGNYNNRNSNNRGNNNRQPDYSRHKYHLQGGKRQDPMGDSRSMGNYAIRLFRDMARGQFNFLADAQKFTNPEFVEAAIGSVNSEIRKSYEIYTAVSAMYNDPSAMDVIQNAYKRNQAYNLCMQALTYIKASNYTDVNYLQLLTANLPNYRFNI